MGRIIDDIFNFTPKKKTSGSKSKPVIHYPTKSAEWYARNALAGGRYLSPGQAAEAFIAANYPIEKVETQVKPESKPKPKPKASPQKSSHYDAYAAAVERQNQILRQQQELLRQQREKEYNAVVDANNRQAAQSMNEVYILNMLTKKNLAQNLKNLGISGGAGETALRDIENAYMNSRMGIDRERLDANNKARLAFEKGSEDDYMKYLSKSYSIAKPPTVTNRAKTTVTKNEPAKKTTGYKIQNSSKVHTGSKEEVKYSIIKELKTLGLTNKQIGEYLAKNGY